MVASAGPKRTAVTPASALPVIVTTVPAAPSAGENPVTLGATRKSAADVTVPASLVTVIRPVDAPIGTVARSAVVTLAFGLIVLALTPSKLTLLVLVRLVPVNSTTVPAGFVMLIGPLVASSGTRARMRLLDTRVTAEAFTPLKVTAVALPTESPSMVTSVPVGAAAGVKAVTVGGRITSNGVALVAAP